MSSFSIQKIVNGKWKQNCYVIHLPSLEALIIDPGSEAERIIQYIEKESLLPLAIVNTHAHFDHIGAIVDLKKYFNIPFYLHQKDKRLLKRANTYRVIFDGDHPIEVPEIDFLLDEQASPVSIKGFTIEIIHTPGHTKGGVCLLIDKLMFTGDTLLKGKVGRTDFLESNGDDLHESLRRLSQLPLYIQIFPGHGEASTIGAVLQMMKVIYEASKTQN